MRAEYFSQRREQEVERSSLNQSLDLTPLNNKREDSFNIIQTQKVYKTLNLTIRNSFQVMTAKYFSQRGEQEVEKYQWF